MEVRDGGTLNAVGVAVDLAGNIYVADLANNRIRKLLAADRDLGWKWKSGFRATRARPQRIAGWSWRSCRGRGRQRVYCRHNQPRVGSVRRYDLDIAGDGDYRFSGDGGPAATAAFSIPVGVTRIPPATSISPTAATTAFGKYRVGLSPRPRETEPGVPRVMEALPLSRRSTILLASLWTRRETFI